MELTAERLRELFEYDSEAGTFKVRTRRGRKAAGSEVGYVANKRDGRIRIRVDGHPYYAYRLAWLYCHGVLPTCPIDHINFNPSDNRISNLRLASIAENNVHGGAAVRRDNKSGVQGVSWRASKRKWLAEIQVNKKKIYLGVFKNIEDAIAARHCAEVKHYGEFSRLEQKSVAVLTRANNSLANSAP